MKLMDSRERGPMNIGSDEEFKLSDVAQKIIDLVGSKSTIKFEKAHSGMHKQGVPDIKLIRDTLGWFPVIKLDDGLKETVDYMRSMQSQYEQQGLWDESTLDRKE